VCGGPDGRGWGLTNMGNFLNDKKEARKSQNLGVSALYYRTIVLIGKGRTAKRLMVFSKLNCMNLTPVPFPSGEGEKAGLANPQACAGRGFSLYNK
jgi:hypothetical protein